MQQQQQQTTIALGDLLQKLALTCYNDLLSVVEMNQNLTPEMRTDKLKSYIKRTKKRMAQTFAILVWLKEEHIKSYAASTSAMIEDVSERCRSIDCMQDSLYFAHMGLYSRRIRPLEIAFCKDLMARGTYAHLPSAIFSCGLQVKPAEADDSLLRYILGIYIRGKLAVSEPIPSICDSMNLRDGVLVISKRHSFRLYLTLSHASETAAWRAIQIHLLVESHPIEFFDTSYENKGLEENILEAVVKVFEKQGDDATSSLPQDCDNNGHSENSSTGKSDPLFRACSICLYGSLSTCLRMLYIQALETSRTIRLGQSEASFSETKNHQIFCYKFWKKRTSTTYPYTIFVALSRSLGQTLIYHLCKIDESDSTNSTSQLSFDSSLNLFFDCDSGGGTGQLTLPERFTADERSLAKVVLGDGVSFNALFQAALRRCTELKMGLLRYCLNKSTEMCAAFEKAGFDRSGLTTDPCMLHLSLADVRLTVALDSKTGSFLLMHQGLAIAGDDLESTFEKFLSEINSVYYDIPSNLRPLEHGKSIVQAIFTQTNTMPFLSLCLVLQYVVLSYWARQFSEILNLPINSNWSNYILKSAGLSAPGFLVEVVSFDEILSKSRLTVTAYNVKVYIALNIDDSFQVKLYRIFASTSKSSTSPRASVPCSERSEYVIDLGVGMNINQDIGLTIRAYLHALVQETMLWTHDTRILFAVNSLSEYIPLSKEHDMKRGLSGRWTLLEIKALQHTASEQSSSPVYVLCRSTLYEATMMLVSNPSDILQLHGTHAHENNSKLMLKPSETALRIDWNAGSQLLVDLVAGRVVLHATGQDETSVISLSRIFRLLARVSHLWPRVRDMMRQLHGRQESLWLSPLGLNRIRVFGIHVLVTLYVSSRDSQVFQVVDTEPLSAVSDDQEQHFLTGAECIGEATFSLGCLKSESEAYQSVRTGEQSSESRYFDEWIQEDYDPLALLTCLGFNMKSSSSGNSQIHFTQGPATNTASPPSAWKQSYQAFEFQNFTSIILNRSLEMNYSRAHHARHNLHVSVASARPMIEFFWYLSRQCHELSVAYLKTMPVKEDSQSNRPNNVDKYSLKFEQVIHPNFVRFGFRFQSATENSPRFQVLNIDVQVTKFESKSLVPMIVVHFRDGAIPDIKMDLTAFRSIEVVQNLILRFVSLSK